MELRVAICRGAHGNWPETQRRDFPISHRPEKTRMYPIDFSSRFLVPALVVGALLLPSLASAQVRVEVGIPAPQFTFQVGGPLVYVGPDVWVLPESDDEVFYNGGWYWARSNDRWYRSHGRQSGWGVVNEQYVPGRIRRMPPGQYRQFHAPERARMMPARGWQERREERGPRMDMRQPFQGERREGRMAPMAPPVRQQRVELRPEPQMRRDDGPGRGHGGGEGRGHGGEGRGPGGGGEEHGHGHGHGH
jgi:hypothetical protein